jgi:L-ascorbate metabolism protein UlaG (beta-lactamase superfamily)
MADITLTWLGHGSFRFDTADGTRVYVDPFLTYNPKCPDDEKTPERVDVIAITHGHMDHVADVVDLQKKHDATVVAMIEIGDWLVREHGVEESKVQAGNKGGSTQTGGVTFTLVDARHSSQLPDSSYGGEAAGIVASAGGKAIYFAGDTDVFGDMQLIARLYEPDLAVLPIGDYFTMGPKQAALALELLGTKRCLPCHYGTFPPLVGTPAELKKLAPAGVAIEDIEPGQSITV